MRLLPKLRFGSRRNLATLDGELLPDPPHSAPADGANASFYAHKSFSTLSLLNGRSRLDSASKKADAFASGSSQPKRNALRRFANRFASSRTLSSLADDGDTTLLHAREHEKSTCCAPLAFDDIDEGSSSDSESECPASYLVEPRCQSAVDLARAPVTIKPCRSFRARTPSQVGPEPTVASPSSTILLRRHAKLFDDEDAEFVRSIGPFHTDREVRALRKEYEASKERRKAEAELSKVEMRNLHTDVDEAGRLTMQALGIDDSLPLLRRTCSSAALDFKATIITSHSAPADLRSSPSPSPSSSPVRVMRRAITYAGLSTVYRAQNRSLTALERLQALGHGRPTDPSSPRPNSPSARPSDSVMPPEPPASVTASADSDTCSDASLACSMADFRRSVEVASGRPVSSVFSCAGTAASVVSDNFIYDTRNVSTLVRSRTSTVEKLSLEIGTGLVGADGGMDMSDVFLYDVERDVGTRTGHLLGSPSFPSPLSVSSILDRFGDPSLVSPIPHRSLSKQLSLPMLSEREDISSESSNELPADEDADVDATMLSAWDDSSFSDGFISAATRAMATVPRLVLERASQIPLPESPFDEAAFAFPTPSSSREAASPFLVSQSVYPVGLSDERPAVSFATPPTSDTNLETSSDRSRLALTPANDSFNTPFSGPTSSEQEDHTPSPLTAKTPASSNRRLRRRKTSSFAADGTPLVERCLSPDAVASAETPLTRRTTFGHMRPLSFVGMGEALDEACDMSATGREVMRQARRARIGRRSRAEAGVEV